MADELNRRNFIKAAAAAAAPAVISAQGTNNKINIGWIGVGTRGYAGLDWLHTAAANEVQVSAIADLVSARVVPSHTFRPTPSFAPFLGLVQRPVCPTIGRDCLQIEQA